jgi:hypothetical protein
MGPAIGASPREVNRRSVRQLTNPPSAARYVGLVPGRGRGYVRCGGRHAESQIVEQQRAAGRARPAGARRPSPARASRTAACAAASRAGFLAQAAPVPIWPRGVPRPLAGRPNRTVAERSAAVAPAANSQILAGNIRAAPARVSLWRERKDAAEGEARADVPAEPPKRRQALPSRRSISATGTPQTSATWATVIPYFTQVRIRASCDAGISLPVAGLGMAGGATVSRRTPAVREVSSARGAAANRSAAGPAEEMDASTLRGFGANSASAARRARLARSRGSGNGSPELRRPGRRGGRLSAISLQMIAD